MLRPKLVKAPFSLSFSARSRATSPKSSRTTRIRSECESVSSELVGSGDIDPAGIILYEL